MIDSRMLLAGAIAAALAAPVAMAATPSGVGIGDATELPAVQVTGKRLKSPVALDTPGTVSTIDREQMDEQLVTTIRDLVRYEPGVSAIGTAGRFGLDSFNIRGLSGNRSYIQVDGVPMPASFGADLGGGVRAGRDFTDLDQIKQVEILRGPISALYPSDALGGAVILTTKDPADYLQPGRSTYTAVKEQYDSTDRSFDTTATLAGGDHDNGFLLSAGYREGHETDNMGDVGGTGAARTKPDPQQYHVSSLLGKYVHTADSGRTDRLSVDVATTHTSTNGLSELVPDPFEGFVPDYYLSQDIDTQLRGSVGQWFPRLDSALADTLDWTLYGQLSRTRSWTQTDTPTVWRYFDTLPLQERVFGGKLVAVKHVEGGAVSQKISYGIEASRTNAQSDVDGYGIDKQTGATGSSSAFMPGNYPLHLFPESNTNRYALFAQDEISLLDGRLVVTPGARAERYEYLPQADALYQAYNPGYVQSDYAKNYVAPKLGAIWHFGNALSMYADYAYGFRPPLYSEIAGAWNEQPVPGVNIAFLPNPDLKAETSRNAEVGLRGQDEVGWFSVGAYYNRYRNFIWSGYQLSPSQVPPWAYQISPGAFFNQFFQAVNASRAVIKGIEASGQLQLGALNPSLQGWSLRASAAIASGSLIQPGEDIYSPLNTVDPAKLVVGVGYDAAEWGAELVGTAVRRHNLLSDPASFRPSGYGTLDFYAHYQSAHSVELYAGLTNLTNRKYWDWGSLNGGTLGNLISGNGVNDAGTGGLPADRLTMPGRNFSVAAKIEF